MAWTYQDTKSYTDSGYQVNETLTIEQVECENTGYARFKLTSRTYVYPGGGGAREIKLSVKYNDNTIESEQVATDSNYVTIDVPNSWLGNRLQFGGRALTFFATPPVTEAGYALVVNADVHVASYTVTRTALGSDFGALGELIDGAVVYVGDVITVTAQAASGYEIVAFQSSYTVSGDTIVVISTQPTATVHIFDGTGWARYSLFVYNGTSWDRYQAKIYNGASWDNYN